MKCPICNSKNIKYIVYDEELETDVYECLDCDEKFIGDDLNVDDIDNE